MDESLVFGTFFFLAFGFVFPNAPRRAARKRLSLSFLLNSSRCLAMFPNLKIKEPRKTYPAAGFCIYCNARDVPLTLEHIVPMQLGGIWELPEASCETCQRTINKQIEQVCLQKILGPIRYKLGIRGRKRKKRASLYPVNFITPDGHRHTVNVPLEEYPDTIAWPIYDPPGLISGKPALLLGDPPVEHWQPHWMVHVNEPIMKSFAQKYGRPHPSIEVERHDLNPLTFNRMLAKIAHAYAVAELGGIKFEPMLLDLILGRAQFSWHLIGSSDISAPPPSTVHKLDLGMWISPAKQKYYAVDIFLLFVARSPAYRIIVGKIPDGSDHLAPNQ